MLTLSDRLVMLDVLYDVRVTLTPDGGHLDVSGPAQIVDAVTPMLKRHRTALIAYMTRQAQPPLAIERTGRHDLPACMLGTDN
jgi:hypothetical protein